MVAQETNGNPLSDKSHSNQAITYNYLLWIFTISSNYCTTCHWLQLAGEFYLSLSAPIYRSNEFTDPTAPGLQGGGGVVYTRHLRPELVPPSQTHTCLNPSAPRRAFRKGEKLTLQIICIFVLGCLRGGRGQVQVWKYRTDLFKSLTSLINYFNRFAFLLRFHA